MDHITRSEFVKELTPVKKDATAAKALAESNKEKIQEANEKIEEICQRQMKFHDINNQEHTNMLIAIARVVDGNAGLKEEVVGLRDDLKKTGAKIVFGVVSFLVTAIVALIAFIAHSGIL